MNLLKKFVAAMMIAAITLSSTAQAFAQVVAADTKTSVYQAPNGVTIVDIATATSSGLSHNKFNDYNVPTNGIVLNNGNFDQATRQSQLAGQVSANFNLKDQATIILNEVVTTNRSQLLGYTEVLGGQADVIVANPNGVTCNGCGFINTSNVTLTTGIPQVANGILSGFNVTDGDILVDGNGLDATGQAYLALVARSVKLNGQVNGSGDVDVVAGSNTWDYNSKTATANAANGNIPQYAIDSTVLGGMYANKIRFIATEAGVGVRALGDVAATASDFTIDASGKIQLSNKISAQRDITITSHSSGADAVKTTNASLSAKRNIQINSTAGGTTLQGGKLIADNNLGINTGTLSDSSTVNSLTDNNKRYAGASVNFTGTGAATINATTIGAHSAVGVNFGSITLGADGAIIYAGTTLGLTGASTVDLGNKGSLLSDGDLTITVTAGNITIGNGTGQGIKSTNGNISLTAFTNFSNAGTISSDNGHVTVKAGNGAHTITNSGTIHAKGDITFSDRLNGFAVDLTNSGSILAENTVVIKAAAIANPGTIQAAKGATVTATSLSNSGNFIASTNAANDGTFNLTSLTNTASGILQSAKSLFLNVATSITNSLKIIAGDDIVIRKPTGTTGVLAIINNAAGIISATDLIDIAANAGTITFDTQAGNVIGNRLSLNVDSLSNSGNILGGTGNSTITVAGILANTSTGKIVSSTGTGTSSFSGNTITNDGIIQSGGALTITLSNQITNTGTGQIKGSGNVTLDGLTAAAYYVYNQGLLQSDALLNIKGNGTSRSVNLYNNQSNSKIIAHDFTTKADSLTVAGGGKITATTGHFDIDVTTLTFADTTTAIIALGTGTAGDSVLRSAGAVSYTGAIHSSHDLSIYGTTVTSGSSSGLSASHDLLVSASAGNITNSGEMYAGNLLTGTASVSIVNNSAFDSDGSMSFTSTNFTNSGAAINAVNNITIVTTNFSNTIPGGVPTRAYDTTQHGFVGTIQGPGGGFIDAISAAFGTSDFHLVETYYNLEYFTSTVSSARSQLIAGGDMNISFHTGQNVAGLIAANNLTLTGTGTTPTFTNEDLSLSRKTYTTTQDAHITCVFAICGDPSFDTPVTSSVTTNESRDGNAGLFVNHLYGTNFSLFNRTDTHSANVTDNTSHTGSTAVGATTVTPGVIGGATSVTFSGLTITLPTNPNGLYIVSQNPNAGYLIETNPLYGPGGNASGSNYLAKKLGIDTNSIEKRLGDANYETYLVRQQVINQTGQNIIKGDETENQQMERLMDNAATESKSQNLEFGKALSKDQISNLKTDMVWMVETEVQGQKVLAPVVYLSAATKTMLASNSGSTIAAGTMDLNLNAMNNSGGTIRTSGDMNIVSKGDITNTSGNINSGGNANLESTNGSIINKTTAETTGSGTNVQTTIGKTAGITSGKDLNLKAKEDITNLGANMGAGGDASLDAGKNITFDTIEDKKASASYSNSSSGLNSTHNSHTEETTKQIGSTLTAGGNLKTKSGNDTTFAGTKVKAGGDADISAGGDLNLINRYDSTKTSDSSSTTGVGVGGSGSLYGTETDSTDKHKTTSVGSSLDVGGNAKMKSDKTMNVVGSDVNVKGDLDMSAKDINIKAAEEVDETTNTKSTTAIGAWTTSDNKSDSGSGSSSDSSTGKSSASANAGVEASASASSDNEVTLMKTNKDTTTDYNLTNRGSTIKSGGNMKVNATNNLKVVGSDVEAGGNADINAKDMSFEAAQDVHTTTKSHNETTMGLYGGGSAEAKAGASASANASPTGADASAEAGASASAEGGAGLVGRNTKTGTTDGTSTAKTSTIKSGGNMTRTATGKITDVGTQIEAGGDFSQSANEIDSKAAENKTWSSSDSEVNTAKLGVYGEASADAKAGADASTNGVGAGGEAGASASAGAQAGVKASYNRNTENTTDTSSKAVTSTIKSGGNFSSTSKGKSTFEGTNIDAGKDASLEAGSLDFKAAKDTTSSTKGTSNIDAELKVGVGASASADASAEGGSGGGSYGVTGSLSGGYSQDDSSSKSSTAVVGGIKSGGNMKVKTTGDATFEGTNLESGGDASVAAGGDLKFNAAHNTEEAHDKGLDVSASLTASKSKGSDGGSSSSKGVSAEGGYTQSNSSSDTGVGSSIKSGGKLDLSSGKNASFEGAKIDSKGDTTVDAKGNVDFKAAKTTTHSDNLGVSGSIGSSKESETGKAAPGAATTTDHSKTSSVSLSGEYGKSDSTTNDVTTINSGGNLKVNSGKSVTLEGTDVAAKGSAKIDAKDNVNFNAVEDSSTSTGVSASIGREKTSKSTTETPAVGTKSTTAKNADGTPADAKATTTKGESTSKSGLSADVKVDNSKTQKGGSIKAGSVDVTSGKDANFTGTKIESEGDANITAGGNANFKATESSATKVDVGATVGKGEGSTNKIDAFDVGKSNSKEGAEVKSTGGNVNVKSGGKTSLEGTKIEADKKASVTADKGVTKSDANSNSNTFGTEGVELGGSDSQKTTIKSNNH